ncbi:hypothetical protein GCM10010305_20500 [Streptomyces termitum]|uniref:Uncharacterized protein n=1 Tax=Streptomyces termitum TaxID=67368 RepID=A0A918SXZ4_9ACTN|nr:hypothetical protein GCM10010305_20500 [Streptomyces termitum]
MPRPYRQGISYDFVGTMPGERRTRGRVAPTVGKGRGVHPWGAVRAEDHPAVAEAPAARRRRFGAGRRVAGAIAPEPSAECATVSFHGAVHRRELREPADLARVS